MPCTGCANRRREIAAAGKALRSGHRQQAAQHVRSAAKSLSDDAKAFARGLQARLTSR